ncbi:papilin-like [Alosa sapidissima]|uniref:papilin-like n=1 Tax=Alosa sapidissima TaxID=34773 RepID=UPI001C08A99D|nr:papilin-like [Alosa sapidissima]
MMLLPLLGVLHLLSCPALSLRQPSEDYWGDYGPYGPCSRTCGTGVALRTRTCVTMRTDGGHNCVGSSKSYKTCNTQPCPAGAMDFREEQCAQFNRVDFQSKRYSWGPYYGATNPCELVCVPRGENFFYRHRPSVVDGTPCYVGRSDICVEGVCRVLTHSGEFLSLETGPSTPSVPSRPSVYEPSAPLRETYRYSMSAFSECSASCGDGLQTRTVQCVTDGSGLPRVVDDSYCASQGLTRPHEQKHCSGRAACAEYSVSSFSTCSASCGQGTQQREVYCVGGHGERLPESACAGLPRPEEVRTCQRPSCHQHISYYVSDWSLCSESCGTGRRDRRVVCMDQDHFEHPDERCASQFKPYTVESCNTQPCPGPQMVPSVADPRGHESSLRGFRPYTPEVDQGSARPSQPYIPVVGPHCAQSYYGCCPDGHTEASGPRGEGCPQDDCVRTRFGCCLDGVTAAQGFGYAGCPDYQPPMAPPAEGDVCTLPREVGPCFNWISRFHFDYSQRTCTHFWFGGCQGNGNNFLSMEACQRQCGGMAPPPPPPAAGPARRPVIRVRPARRRPYHASK